MTTVRIGVPAAHAAAAQTLRTARMVLRPLTPADWPEFARTMRSSREHLARFFPLGQGDEPEAAAFERHMELSGFSGAAAPDWRRAAFTPGGRLVGEFNLNAIRRGLEFRAEAAWWVSREFCGRGYATEGVRAILEFAFGDLGSGGCGSGGCGAGTAAAGGLGLHRVDAMICPENAASRRIVRKLGFITPRTPVRVSLNVGGEWRLHEMFTRYIDPAAQIEAKPLPASLGRVGDQVHVLERTDPGDMLMAAPA